VPADTEAPFDPAPALAALAEGSVDFVVIGGVAGGAHGSAFGTRDLDVLCSPAPENLERLAGVLRSLRATLRGAPRDVPFQLDDESLAAGGNFSFDTSFGALDALTHAAGAPPYERLKADAITIDVRGHAIRVASLDHLIAMKEAAGRPRDKNMALEYRLLSDQLRAPRDE
jgi:hypothetical protein